LKDIAGESLIIPEEEELSYKEFYQKILNKKKK
jgi:hypothetical protein